MVIKKKEVYFFDYPSEFIDAIVDTINDKYYIYALDDEGNEYLCKLCHKEHDTVKGYIVVIDDRFKEPLFEKMIDLQYTHIDNQGYFEKEDLDYYVEMVVDWLKEAGFELW